MIIYKLRNHLILGLLMLGAVCFTSCQKEEMATLDSQNVVTDDYTLTKVSAAEIRSNRALAKQLSVYAQAKEAHQQSRTLHSGGRDFHINTDHATYIEHPNGAHSYTFPIQYVVEDGKLNNLVLASKRDGSYDGYYLSYDLTDAQMQRVEKGGSVDLKNRVSVAYIKDDINLLASKATIFDACLTYDYSHGPCNNGNSYEHDPEPFLNGGMCSGSTQTIIGVTYDFDCIDAYHNGGGGPVGGGNPGTGGGGTISSSPTSCTGCTPPPCLPFVKKDTSFQGTALDCIFDKMKDACNSAQKNIFTQMLESISNQNVPIVFSYGNTPSDTTAFAITEGYGVDVFGTPVTYINIIANQTNIAGQPNLVKELTLVHEIMHAHMYLSLLSEGILTFDAQGFPTVDPSTLCNGFVVIPNVNLNNFSVADRWTYLICEYNNNNPQDSDWTHDLFNTALFNVDTYQNELQQFLVNHHDWAGETATFRNEAIAAFGANWKEKVAERMSWIGLEKIDGGAPFTAYLNSFAMNPIQSLYVNTFEEFKLPTANNVCVP